MLRGTGRSCLHDPMKKSSASQSTGDAINLRDAANYPTKFEFTRALARKSFQEFPEPYRSSIGDVSVDVFASGLLAKCWGFSLHAKVNDAFVKVAFGKASETPEYRLINDVF